MRFGMLAAVMVNMWSSSKSQRVKPADFIPDYFKLYVRPKRQTADEMYAILLRGTQQVGRVITPGSKED